MQLRFPNRLVTSVTEGYENGMDLPYLSPLTAKQQAQFGLSETWPLALADRVRFAEIDRQNHANNAAYMTWFETARLQYFQDWGMLNGRPDDPHFVLRRAEIDYLEALRLGDDYVTTVACKSFRTSSFTLGCELWANGRLAARFSGVIVLLAPDGGKKAIPDTVRHRFETVDGAKAD